MNRVATGRSRLRSLPSGPVDRRFAVRRLYRRIMKITQLIWRILSFPIRAILAVRRAMTGASVTLLLVGIVSANIIWGYPWIGIFSACISLFLVGFVLNRWSLPRLESEFLLPRSAVAGSTFQAQTILTNPSRLPALELQVRLKPRRKLAGDTAVRFETELSGGIVPMIHPGQRIRLNTSLVCHSRGLHRLPDVSVTTWFPFYLFRHTSRVKTNAQIAITPRLLTADDDAINGGLLDSLGNWTRKLLSGDAMDYTGSREYEPGMPVRRWDFASWARLGQPIIREFQSPSVRTITLIVDTATDSMDEHNPGDPNPLLERVLSLAATAIDRVCRNPIQVRMFVTGQDPVDQSSVGTERESLLIRLAMARSEAVEIANQKIDQWCNRLDQSPVLILTSRSNPLGKNNVPTSISILRIDLSETSESIAFGTRMGHERIQGVSAT